MENADRPPPDKSGIEAALRGSAALAEDAAEWLSHLTWLGARAADLDAAEAAAEAEYPAAPDIPTDHRGECLTRPELMRLGANDVFGGGAAYLAAVQRLDQHRLDCQAVDFAHRLPQLRAQVRNLRAQSLKQGEWLIAQSAGTPLDAAIRLAAWLALNEPDTAADTRPLRHLTENLIRLAA